ncbi:MAG: NAD(P)/FAD-dependent oxidoreductase [Clostridia bacterium]|nr:NAD(P)/FAD-dependent oxidoreductase [Clostridia bacterium]
MSGLIKVAVIGGGASGMMASCIAARNGADVTLYERGNICGVKLNITGKGRCNITNNCDLNTLISNTVKNGRFLYSAFSAFDSQSAIAFFEDCGVRLKTERGNRVFPVSDSAKEVSGALRTAMHRLGVKIINKRVISVCEENGVVCGVKAENGAFQPFDRVIIATGGMSYPRTGSTGDGYRMARAMGHTVTELSPSLVPLVIKGSIPKRLEGLALKNVGLTVTSGNKTIYTDFGEMVFTSNGVSGPMILSASAHMGRKTDFPYEIVIDLKPALTQDVLDKRVLSDFDDAKNRDFANSLGKLLPSKIIPVIIELSGIPADKKVNSITAEERGRLCGLVKGLRLQAVSFGSMDEAVVTSGGITVKEINPKTMESKLIRGLYFCGEVIDVNAYTGGFNLQIAWSTGYCAGTYAAGKEV